jgi:hypothetical protein
MDWAFFAPVFPTGKSMRGAVNAPSKNALFDVFVQSCG